MAFGYDRSHASWWSRSSPIGDSADKQWLQIGKAYQQDRFTFGGAMLENGIPQQGALNFNERFF